MSSVYFIQAGPDGPIKIGRAKDVMKRMSMLQTGQAAKLRLLARVRGGAIEERSFHETFAAHRLNGEWFAPHADVMNCIKRLRGDQEIEKPEPTLTAYLCDDGGPLPVVCVAGFASARELTTFCAGLKRGII